MVVAAQDVPARGHAEKGLEEQEAIREREAGRTDDPSLSTSFGRKRPDVTRCALRIVKVSHRTAG